MIISTKLMTCSHFDRLYYECQIRYGFKSSLDQVNKFTHKHFLEFCLNLYVIEINDSFGLMEICPSYEMSTDGLQVFVLRQIHHTVTNSNQLNLTPLAFELNTVYIQSQINI